MKKCKYCDGEHGDSPSKFLLQKKLNFGELGEAVLALILFDDKYLACSLEKTEKMIKINYCPMCGRKLDPEKLEEDAQ